MWSQPQRCRSRARHAGLGRCCGPRPGPAVVCAPGSRPGASGCSWSFPILPNATHVATRPTRPPRLLGLTGRPFLPAPVPGPAARLSPSGHGRGLHPAGPLDMGGRKEHWRGGGMQGGVRAEAQVASVQHCPCGPCLGHHVRTVAQVLCRPSQGVQVPP